MGEKKGDVGGIVVGEQGGKRGEVEQSAVCHPVNLTNCTEGTTLNTAVGRPCTQLCTQLCTQPSSQSLTHLVLSFETLLY